MRYRAAEAGKKLKDHAKRRLMSTVASFERREPIRDDRASPTMQKVWEKHRRKEERDAQILESRRLAAEERMVRNAFNVPQSQHSACVASKLGKK
eukprot:Skav213184  [mRNA]  locus=scaffold2826:12280:16623:+ [translate_table: standard]